MNSEPQNPARAVSIPPALLQELEKNPDAFKPHARMMLANHINNTHFLLKDPTVPFSQRLQFMDFLAKVTGSYVSPNSTPATTGSNFSLNIVLTPPTPTQSTQITIEAEASPKQPSENLLANLPITVPTTPATPNISDISIPNDLIGNALEDAPDES
jgi:hypothetical protein